MRQTARQWARPARLQNREVRKREKAEGGDQATHGVKLPSAKRNAQRGVTASSKVSVHQVDQLIIHRLGLFRSSLDGRGRAVFQVVAHELTAHAAQRFMH